MGESMTFTPGPWKFSESKLASGWGLVIDSHENIIANVNTETGPDIQPLVSTKMPCKANGMVIAAVPDILAALLAFERATQLNNVCNDDPSASLEWMDASDDAVSMCAAVLQRLRDAGVIAHE